MPRTTFDSPIGPILLEAAGERLIAIRIGPASDEEGEAAVFSAARAQLRRYFAGEQLTCDLPLAPPRSPRGGALRDAIVGIGFGKTISYGTLARAAESSPRAVGQACARNPFPIVVPCHRVTGAAGAMGYYSAGAGVATKRWLLDHERRV